MIVTVTGETTCPECDYPFDFEVSDIEGQIEIECPACKNKHEIDYKVVIELY